MTHEFLNQSKVNNYQVIKRKTENNGEANNLF